MKKVLMLYMVAACGYIQAGDDGAAGPGAQHSWRTSYDETETVSIGDACNECLRGFTCGLWPKSNEDDARRELINHQPGTQQSNYQSLDRQQDQ